MSTFRQKFQAKTNWVKPDPADLVEAPRRPRRAAKRRGAPVTAHRLFPAFAALWFAALFGLGSLAIPGALLGAVVVKTGLPAVLPAAAPPLGTTAHFLVAFALAMFGAALGLALALRLRPQGLAEAGAAEARRAEVVVPAPPPVQEAEETYKVRARDAHPDAPPRRPLVLTEALVDPIDEPAAEEPTEFEPAEPLLRRKRSFFSSEPVAEPAAPWIPEFTPGGQGTIRPLDLSALDLEDPIEQPFFARPEPEHQPEAQVEAGTEPEAQPEPALEPAAEVAEPAAPVLIAATPQLPAGFTAALADTADGKWSPVAGAPLENLGLVQLIERLALAIAEQKAANEAVIAADAAAEAAAAPVAEEIAAEPEFAPGPFSQLQMVSPAAEAADVPAAGSAREAILRRLGALAAGEPAEAAASAPAARPFTRPAPVVAPTDAVVPIRPAEAAAPAVPLPATAPMAPVEADEALRSALATLQRMTARG